jgi:hypothetical protein
VTDERWLAEMRRSLRPNAYLRLVENRFVSTESTFVDMSWYDACVEPSLKPIPTDPELPVWVGIDASVKHDSTAIVANNLGQGKPNRQAGFSQNISTITRRAARF